MRLEGERGATMAVPSTRSKRRQMMKLDFAVQRIDEAMRPLLVTLNEHKLLMDEFRRSKDYAKLHNEQLRTAGTVNQLKSAMKGLDVLRNQASPEELEYLNDKITPLQTEISKCVQEMVNGQNLYSSDFAGTDEDEAQERDALAASGSGQYSQAQKNLELEGDISEKRTLLSSWKNLSRDLVDLNATVNKLANLVWNQKENVNGIENNISVAEATVHQGAVELSRIRRGIALPLIGAALGTAVAGPIGLLAGFKIGALACVGTAALGYTTGKVAQKFANPPAIELPQEQPKDSSENKN